MPHTLSSGRHRSGSVHHHGRQAPGWIMDKPRRDTIDSSFLPAPAMAAQHHSFLSSAKSSLSQLTALKPSVHGTPSLTHSAPSASTMRFLALCSLWYLTSALSSNTGKSIMIQFRYPVTLTFVQFAFVSGYCGILMHPRLGMTTLRTPTRAIIRSTLPMAAFQVGGHIFSSMAISRVPVSTVHTIKALSPLFTVAAYRLLFGVSYSFRTYASLLPLTLGVMLACTFDVAGSNLVGLLCAFGSALVFVSSNIFFKKIMPSNGASTAHKLDKLNLLFYSSGLAFLLMIPIWMYYDFGHLWRRWHDDSLVSDPSKPTAHGVMYYFFLNGTVHWAQNIIAFAILASTSPVTYSIASLIKRVAVICIAIVWFSQSVHPVQALGIMLTFAGLWLYNQAKSDVERGESKARRVEASRQLQLPTTKSELITPNSSPRPEHVELHTYQTAPPRSHPPMRQTNGMSINIPASKPLRQPISPTESYPSPPASLDSPPHSAGGRANGYLHLKNRKSTHDEVPPESGVPDATPKMHAQPMAQF